MSEMTLKEKKISLYEDELQELKERLKLLQYKPEYRGILVIKYVKCGKPGCRCQNGEPHGPYIYRQFYDKGKKCQIYVSKKEAPKIAEIVNQNQLYKKTLHQIKTLEKKIKEEEKA